MRRFSTWHWGMLWPSWRDRGDSACGDASVCVRCAARGACGGGGGAGNRSWWGHICLYRVRASRGRGVGASGQCGVGGPVSARLVLISWTAGPLAVLLPVDGDAVALVRPYLEVAQLGELAGTDGWAAL